MPGVGGGDEGCQKGKETDGLMEGAVVVRHAAPPQLPGLNARLVPGIQGLIGRSRQSGASAWVDGDNTLPASHLAVVTVS